LGPASGGAACALISVASAVVSSVVASKGSSTVCRRSLEGFGCSPGVTPGLEAAGRGLAGATTSEAKCAESSADTRRAVAGRAAGLWGGDCSLSIAMVHRGSVRWWARWDSPTRMICARRTAAARRFRNNALVMLACAPARAYAWAMFGMSRCLPKAENGNRVSGAVW
jgi:hypothetical protein